MLVLFAAYAALTGAAQSWESIRRMLKIFVISVALTNILAIASVFVLRVKRPELPRPYRVWGYPVTPALFLLAALFLMGDMLRQKPAESLAGLLIVFLGLPAYWAFVRKGPPPTTDPDLA